MDNNKGESWKELWRELTLRTRFLYISASLAFVCGWVLTFWGFILPPAGVVDNTVLVILGQCLSYCACAFGLGEYVQYQIKKWTYKRQLEKGNEEN